MKYKPGDEVLIKAEITDVSDCSERPYFVAPDCRSINWVSEDKIIPMDKTYTQGLSDAWELAKKIVCVKGFNMDELDAIFGKRTSDGVFEKYTAEEALAKIEAYEKEKEIKVGDKVKGVIDDGTVTKISENIAYVLWKDGSCGKHSVDTLEKTGKHIDIESLLRQIGE